MTRPNITEVSTDEAIVRYTDRFFRRVYAETPAIPATYDGKYALIAVIAVNTAPTEAQMDTLQTQIEAITGVHKAFVLIGPARIPLDRVPDDTAETTYSLHIGAEAGFDIRATPVTP